MILLMAKLGMGSVLAFGALWTLLLELKPLHSKFSLPCGNKEDHF